MEVVFFFFVIFILVLIFGSHAGEQKRLSKFQDYAQSRGLSYDPEKKQHLDKMFPDLPFLKKAVGKDHFRGKSQEMDFWFFELVENCGDSYSEHISTLLCLHPSYPLKDLSIRRTGVWDRVASVFGFKQILIAQPLFQDMFWVKGPDSAWAHHVLTHEKINWLLRSQPREEFHMRAGWLLVRQDRSLHTEELDPLLDLAHRMFKDV